MFTFELPILGTGLMITVIILVILYLLVLVKLNPSTKGKRIIKNGGPKQEILEDPPTEQLVENAMDDEVKEENVEFIEMQETVSPAPFENEKAGVNGCPHYFGYLANHPKNTPMPNECLTCTHIMECLSKVE